MQIIQSIILDGPRREDCCYSLNRDIGEWQALLEQEGQAVLLKQEVKPGSFRWIDPNGKEKMISIPFGGGTLVVHHSIKRRLKYRESRAHFVLVYSIPAEQYCLWLNSPKMDTTLEVEGAQNGKN